VALVIGKASNVIIRTFENSDPRVGIVGNGHKNLSARVLANKIEDRVRVNSSNGSAAIREDIRVEFGVPISKFQAYCAKELAFTAINGSYYEESYESLPQCCIDLTTANPDAVAPRTIPKTLKTMPNCLQQLAGVQERPENDVSVLRQS
jgi:hypothetical protein